MPQDKLRILYDNMTSGGYKLGSYDNFKEKMSDKNTRMAFYENMKKQGIDVPDYDHYNSYVESGLGGNSESQTPDKTTSNTNVSETHQDEKEQPAPRQSKTLDNEPQKPKSEPQENESETNIWDNLQKHAVKIADPNKEEPEDEWSEVKPVTDEEDAIHVLSDGLSNLPSVQDIPNEQRTQSVARLAINGSPDEINELSEKIKAEIDNPEPEAKSPWQTDQTTRSDATSVSRLNIPEIEDKKTRKENVDRARDYLLNQKISTGNPENAMEEGFQYLKYQNPQFYKNNIEGVEGQKTSSFNLLLDPIHNAASNGTMHILPKVKMQGETIGLRKNIKKIGNQINNEIEKKHPEIFGNIESEEYLNRVLQSDEGQAFLRSEDGHKFQQLYGQLQGNIQSLKKLPQKYPEVMRQEQKMDEWQKTYDNYSKVRKVAYGFSSALLEGILDIPSKFTFGKSRQEIAQDQQTQKTGRDIIHLSVPELRGYVRDGDGNIVRDEQGNPITQTNAPMFGAEVGSLIPFLAIMMATEGVGSAVLGDIGEAIGSVRSAQKIGTELSRVEKGYESLSKGRSALKGIEGGYELGKALDATKIASKEAFTNIGQNIGRFTGINTMTFGHTYDEYKLNGKSDEQAVGAALGNSLIQSMIFSIKPFEAEKWAKKITGKNYTQIMNNDGLKFLQLMKDPDTYGKGLNGWTKLGLETLSSGAHGAMQGTLIGLAEQAKQLNLQGHFDKDAFQKILQSATSFIFLNGITSTANGLKDLRSFSRKAEMNNLYNVVRNSETTLSDISKQEAKGNLTEKQSDFFIGKLGEYKGIYDRVSKQTDIDGNTLGRSQRKKMFANEVRKAELERKLKNEDISDKERELYQGRLDAINASNDDIKGFEVEPPDEIGGNPISKQDAERAKKEGVPLDPKVSVPEFKIDENDFNSDTKELSEQMLESTNKERNQVVKIEHNPNGDNNSEVDFTLNNGIGRPVFFKDGETAKRYYDKWSSDLEKAFEGDKNKPLSEMSEEELLEKEMTGNEEEAKAVQEELNSRKQESQNDKPETEEENTAAGQVDMNDVEKEVSNRKKQSQTDETESKKDRENPTFLESEGQQVSYEGVKGELKKDGQTYVVENETTIREIGNVDKLKDRPLSSEGVEKKEMNTTINEDGSITHNDKTYQNRYSDPLQAITRDENGNVKNVTLETDNGEKRTFRRQSADDIAYQLTLKDISKNGTREQFNNERETTEEIERTENELRENERPSEEVSDENNAEFSGEKRTENEAGERGVKEKQETHPPEKENEEIKIFEDPAENKDANEKLTKEDNPEQEPNVESIERKAETAKEAPEIGEGIEDANKTIDRALDVEQAKVSDIHTDENRFQGRQHLNEDVVDRIAKKWNDSDQDPIQIWRDPKDGKLYVLSGHHRLEAAKRAGRENIKVVDRSKDFNEKQAIKYATEEANANRTMETPLERAATLRKKRENGDKDIEEFLDREGKNANYIENLSYLNPNGKTMDALKSMDSAGDRANQKEIEKIADWIGAARKSNERITDKHENEMFDFLMDKSASKRITRKSDFIHKVTTAINDFDPTEPLNLKRFKYKSQGEEVYEQEVGELKDQINERQDKINNLKARFRDPNREDYIPTESRDYSSAKKIADEKISKLNSEIKAIQSKLQKLYQDKRKFTENKQSSLFQTEISSEFKPVKRKRLNKLLKGLSKVFSKVKGFKGFVVLPEKEIRKMAKNIMDGKFNIVGEKARLKQEDIDDLLEAVRMDKANKSSKEIWASTGWEKSKDGHWQKDGDYIKVPDRTIELFDRAQKGEIVSGKIGDLVDLGELAELYPELKNLKVEFFRDPTTESFGELQPVLDKNGKPIKRIFINAREDVITKYEKSGYAKGERPVPNEAGFPSSKRTGETEKSTSSGMESERKRRAGLRDRRNNLTQLLSHEIQHFIQEKEGWSSGTSIDLEIKKEIDSRIQSLKNRISVERSRGNNKEADNLQNRLSNLKKLTLEDVKRGRSSNAYLQSLYRNAYHQYLDNPGEVQARNAAIRSQLSPKERKQSGISETADTKFLSDGDTVYGIVHDGKVYLNGSKLNRNTPMHEATHLLWDWFKDNAPELHRTGLDMMEGTKYLRRVKNSEFYQKQAERLSQSGATDKEIEDFYRDEALAMAVGDRGEKLSGSLKSSFRKWWDGFWNKVKQVFGKGNPKLEDKTPMQIAKMNLEEFTDEVAKRLLSGYKLEGGEFGNKESRFQAKDEVKIPEGLYNEHITGSPGKDVPLEETKNSYGSRKRFLDAIKKVAGDAGRIDFRQFLFHLGGTGNIRAALRKRTVLRSFVEKGKVDYVGRRITSPADLADLYTIHRSPLIEKGHVVYIKDGKIIGADAVTSGLSNATHMPDIDYVINKAKKIGADGIYQLHNHPSGDPTPSLQDLQLSTHTADRIKAEGLDYNGHVVMDTDKFAFIKNDDSVSKRDYKKNPEKLFSTRIKLGSGKEAANNLSQLTELFLKGNDEGHVVVYANSKLDIIGWDVVGKNDLDKVGGSAKEQGATNMFFMSKDSRFIDNLYHKELPVPITDAFLFKDGKVTSSVFDLKKSFKSSNLNADKVRKLWEDAADYKNNEVSKESIKEAQEAYDKIKNKIDKVGDRYSDEAKKAVLKKYKDRVESLKKSDPDIAAALRNVHDGNPKENTPEAQAEHYSNVAGSTPKENSKGIAPEPIVGQKPKKINDIIEDFVTGLNLKLRKIKPNRRTAGAAYRTSDAGVIARSLRKLPEIAHEAGHFLDDKFGILKGINQDDAALVKELEKFSEFEMASKPPEGMSSEGEFKYRLGEGLAEWMRSYIAAPHETIRQAPEIYRRYRDLVPDEVKAVVDEYSKQYRIFEGASGYEKELSSTRMDMDEVKSNVLKAFFSKEGRARLRKKRGKDGSVILWTDLVATQFTNPLRVFKLQVRYLQGLKGIDEIVPKDDPYLLARLFAGEGGKFLEFLKHGIRDSKNKILYNEDGKPINLDSLLEPFSNLDEGTVQTEVKQTAMHMTSERTVELYNRFLSENIKEIRRNEILKKLNKRSLSDDLLEEAFNNFSKEVQDKIMDKANKLARQRVDRMDISGSGAGVLRDVDVARQNLEEFDLLPKETQDRIKKAAKAYRDFADASLRYMVDKGRLSQEQYDLIKEHNAYYIAFNRNEHLSPDEEIQVFKKGSGGKAIGMAEQPIKKLIGSDLERTDPYSALLGNMHKMMREADRNEIFIAFRNLATNPRGMHEGEPIPISQIVQKGDSKHAIPIYVNGEKEMWTLEPHLYKSVKGLTDNLMEINSKWARTLLFGLPKLLRGSIVHNPVFQLRNIIRDTPDRIIKSNTGSGFKEIFKGDKQDWNDIAAFGGLQSGYYASSPKEYYKFMKKSMKEISKNDKNILVDGDKLKNAFSSYKNFMEKGETVNRVAEYRSAFKYAKKKLGYDDYNAELYAAFRARDLMDFALMGHTMRWINKVIPFSNAAVQGVRSSVLSAKENPGGFALRMAVNSVIPQLVLWLWNHRNEDAAKRYESIPAYQRDLFWNIDMFGRYITIPKPYELGMFASSVDRAMSKATEHNKNAFSGYVGQIFEAISPVNDLSALAGPYANIVQAATNYDFFRQKHIIPVWEENKPLEDRKNDYASRFGKWVQKVAPIDARKVDFLMRSTFGYFGSQGLKVSNIGRKEGVRFSVNDLGLSKNYPAYNSKEVQSLMDYVRTHSKTSTKAYKKFRETVNKYFNATDNKERNRMAEKMIHDAKVLRKRFENESKGNKKSSTHISRDRDNKHISRSNNRDVHITR